MLKKIGAQIIGKDWRDRKTRIRRRRKRKRTEETPIKVG